MKKTLTIIAIALFTGCDPVTHGEVDRVETTINGTECLVRFIDEDGDWKSSEFIKCPDSTKVGSKVTIQFN